METNMHVSFYESKHLLVQIEQIIKHTSKHSQMPYKWSEIKETFHFLNNLYKT